MITIKLEIMKKALRILMAMIMVVGLMGVCGTVSSCKSSSETMYSSKKKTAKKINRNYKVRGNNQRNSSTYHSY